ncbi:hypothetical protein [Methanoculleus chikugoensis]|uniref:hypothetical protein n=1 Tax=Methanoculleus chikugoensis TaxID=118126 RepID=UPI001FB4A355|nr:hypothetical protein [Methanoculleus chikugoensis]
MSFDREKYRRFFSEEEIARGGVCLACRAYVVGDVQVEVPAGSLIEEQKILVEIPPGMQEIPAQPPRRAEIRGPPRTAVP